MTVPLPKYLGLVEQKGYGSSIVWFDEMSGLSQQICRTALLRLDAEDDGTQAYMIGYEKPHNPRPTLRSNPLCLLIRELLGPDAQFDDFEALLITPRGGAMLRMALRTGAE